MELLERDLCIYDIFFHSGIRSAGIFVDRMSRKRANQGILYIKEGAVLFTKPDKEQLVAKTNDIVIIPKGQYYSMEYIADKTEFYLINFEMSTPSSSFFNLTNDIEIILHGLSSIYVLDIFKKLEASCSNEKNVSFFKRKEYLYRLIGELYSNETLSFLPTLPKYAVISHGVQMLQELYLENIPTSEFAVACNISVSSFRQLFAEYFGISPVQYRNRMRLKRAHSLLLDGELNIAEVAAASGFPNEGYFCRYYKKMMGETPSETRMNYK